MTEPLKTENETGIFFEICADSLESALAAQQGGADRVELCCDLIEGGLTPSPGTLYLARTKLKIGLQVLIRPRGGDFCYSPAEFEVMQADIQAAKNAGADGIVSGILLPDGSVDVERTRRLVDLARPLNFTFHRAFDMSRDPFESLETLAALGVNRILTSGQEANALEGIQLIAQLVQRARGRLIIMPGGGVKESNIREILSISKVNEVHFSASTSFESQMVYRNPRCSMVSQQPPAEYSLKKTDEIRVRELIRLARMSAS